MFLVRAAIKPWPEKLCGMPNMPYRKISRVPTMAANFQRRVLFITKTESEKILRLLPLLGLRFFVCGGQLRHRSLGHFEPEVVRRNPQMDRVFLQSHDRAPQAAAGGDFVPSLDALE